MTPKIDPREIAFREDFQALLNKHNADYESSERAEISLPSVFTEDGNLLHSHHYFDLDRFIYSKS